MVTRAIESANRVCVLEEKLRKSNSEKIKVLVLLLVNDRDFMISDLNEKVDERVLSNMINLEEFSIIQKQVNGYLVNTSCIFRGKSIILGLKQLGDG